MHERCQHVMQYSFNRYTLYHYFSLDCYNLRHIHFPRQTRIGRGFRKLKLFQKSKNLKFSVIDDCLFLKVFAEIYSLEEAIEDDNNERSL